MPDSCGFLSVIILAAGAASRIGRPKQNLAFRGRTLLQTSIDAALGLKAIASLPYEIEVIVVLGANEDEIRKRTDFLNCVVTVNGDWSTGMASSIRQGVRLGKTIHNGKLKNCGAILMVADVPFITTSHLENLVREFDLLNENSKAIICSSYQSDSLSQLGVPALFGTGLFDALMSLSGDSGAKSIILENQYNQSIFRSIEFLGGQFDVDTDADYQSLLQN